MDVGKVLACHQVHSHSGQNPIVESDQSWPEYNPSKGAERVHRKMVLCTECENSQIYQKQLNLFIQIN